MSGKQKVKILVSILLTVIYMCYVVSLFVLGILVTIL
jgi:hypothetical protein